MAGLPTCRNPSIGGKNELAGALIKGNSISAVSYAPTPTPTEAPFLTPAPVSAPGLPARYTDKDLQRASKWALESFVKG